MENTPLDHDLLDQPNEPGTFRRFARRGERFWNYFIDFSVVFGLCYAILRSPLMLGGSGGFDSIQLIFFFILIFYYGMMESVTSGKTIGKYLTRTRAVNFDGSRIGLGTGWTRTFCRAIPFEALSIFFGDGFRMWHDKLTKTIVVKE